MTAKDLLRSYEDSTTIQGAREARGAISANGLIASVGTTLANVALTEIGITGTAGEILSHAAHGALSGQDVETIGINAGIALAFWGIGELVGGKKEEKIAKGRINATPLDPETIPEKYKS